MSIYPSHAARKEKAQFIEVPKHTHGGKQGVGGVYLSLGGGEELGSVLGVLCFSPVPPSPISPHIM